MPTAAQQRILVVDRDAATRQALSRTLRDAGFDAVVAGSAEEATSVAGDHAPALVVASGDGAPLRALREAPATRELPMVAVTSGEGALEGALTDGADDAVDRDAPGRELVARVRGQLRLAACRRELARTQRDARVMVEVTHALTSSLDFREILFTVVRRIAEVMRVERCSIVVAREGGDVGFVVAASDDPRVRNLQIDLYRYPEIQTVLQSRRPLTIDDATSHPLLWEVRAHVSGTRTPRLTIVPIAYEGRAMGVLFLRASEGRGTLDEADLSFCQSVANATAVALRNARLVQKLREERLAVTSAHVEAERRVRLLERYADLFQSSADGMAVIDHDGRVLFANPKTFEITGYSEREVQGGLAIRLVAREDRPRVRSLRDGFRRGEFPANVDVRLRRRDGALRTVSIATSSVLRDEQAVLVTFRDVTEERATALELARTKEFLSSLIEASPDAIIAARLDGTVVLFNPAAERILGYRRADVVGSASAEMLYPPGVARDIMRRIRAAPEGRLASFRAEVVSRDGERIPVLLSAALVSGNGTEVATVGVFSDIRDRIRMEERLAQFQQQLALSEKQVIVAELAGAAAHELNQPLTAIQGYAELLQRKAGADTAIGSGAAVILRESERMAEIVRKIGRITRYETKQYVGGTTILDLDRATEANDPRPQED